MTSFELIELSKQINRSKRNDIRAYHMAVIEETLQIGASQKAPEIKLATGKDRMYSLRDGTIKVAGRFNTSFYASDVRPVETTENTSSTCDVPQVTKEEVRKALKGMKKGNALGDDGISMDLLKEGGGIVLEKLAVLFPNCLKTRSIHSLKTHQQSSDL